MLSHPEPSNGAARPLRLAGGPEGARSSRRRDLSAIRTLPLEMGEADSTEEALHALISTMARATGWGYAESWVLQDGMATACASHNEIGESLHDFASIFAGTRIVATEGLPGIAVRAGDAVWIENLSTIESGTFLRRSRGLEAGFVAAAVLPLISQGEIQGVVSFFLREGEMPDPRERRLIEKAVLPLGEMLRHHRLEDELRRHDRDLERRLEESRLRVDRLVEQVREAERWATVGTFAAGVVHDLTNSLFPLRCRTDLLRRMELPEKARAHVEAIDSAIAYLDRLAANLRSLCRGDGAISETASTSCVSTWWREHRRIIQGQLGPGVSLHAILAPQLPLILVGEDALAQMVVNLVDNAAKAVSGAGSIVVTASLDQDPRFVRLCVADDGPGMDSRQRREAFRARTRDRQGVGRGFGLAMVRGLVERTGGSIEIDATDGEGTRVSLLLPVAETAARDSQPAAVLVDLKDARIAGMVAELFRLLHGGRVEIAAADSIEEDVEILVVAASKQSLRAARRFIGSSPHRRVLAIGGGSAWTGIPATVVADPHDAGALREGVAEVVADGRRQRPLR